MAQLLASAEPVVIVDKDDDGVAPQRSGCTEGSDSDARHALWLWRIEAKLARERAARTVLHVGRHGARVLGELLKKRPEEATAMLVTDLGRTLTHQQPPCHYAPPRLLRSSSGPPRPTTSERW